MYTRVMSIDYGEKRIGIAISDPLRITAQGLETYVRKKLELDLEYLIQIAKKNDVNTLVVGLPKNMNGSEGFKAEEVKSFVAQLHEIAPELKIVFIDERLSTVSAQRVLIDGNVRRGKRKNVVDKLAATIILQSYLDSKN